VTVSPVRRYRIAPRPGERNDKGAALALETETGIIADNPRGVDRPPGSSGRVGLPGFDAARETAARIAMESAPAIVVRKPP
jgi:hypothetical protein